MAAGDGMGWRREGGKRGDPKGGSKEVMLVVEEEEDFGQGRQKGNRTKREKERWRMAGEEDLHWSPRQGNGPCRRLCCRSVVPGTQEHAALRRTVQSGGPPPPRPSALRQGKKRRRKRGNMEGQVTESLLAYNNADYLIETFGAYAIAVRGGSSPSRWSVVGENPLTDTGPV